MKQIIALVLAVCIGALLSEAFVYTNVTVHILNTGEARHFDFGSDTIKTLHEVISFLIGYRIEDQRLYHKGDRPITEEITKFEQLKKPVPLEGRYIFLMPLPLGEQGAISVVSGNNSMTLNVSGQETLGSLKQKTYEGRVFLFEFELTDDSKTLDYYQIGVGYRLIVLPNKH